MFDVDSIFVSFQTVQKFKGVKIPTLTSISFQFIFEPMLISWIEKFLLMSILLKGKVWRSREKVA